MKRVATASLLIGLGVLVLAGCASVAAPGSGGPSGPSGQAGEEFDVDAAWLAGGSIIAIVTQGSSSCVPTAASATAQADGTLAVTLEDPELGEGQGCTADLAPRATLVVVPEGIDVTQDLAIRVDYGIDSWAETELDGFEGPAVDEYAPSAGVVDDDVIALLTWGSSSCAPRVESVEVEGATVSVIFVTPPADQMCTMDMGPRATVISTLNADEADTVTLSGGEFATPVVVPLAD